MSRKRKKNKENKKIHLFEEVLQLLRDVRKPLNYKQISARLGIEDQSQRTLVGFLLRDMEKKKILKEEGKGQYVFSANNFQRENNKEQKIFKRESDSLTGTVDMTSSGSAYVEVEGREQDIYVSQRNTLNTMDKDKVKVRLIQNRKGKKPEGVIEEIIQRAK